MNPQNTHLVNDLVNNFVLEPGHVSALGNQLISDEHKDKYNCPKCDQEVWIVKGLLYKGACEACLSKQNTVEKAASAIQGILIGIKKPF